jgi:hypothetical protein
LRSPDAAYVPPNAPDRMSALDNFEKFLHDDAIRGRARREEGAQLAARLRCLRAPRRRAIHREEQVPVTQR